MQEYEDLPGIEAKIDADRTQRTLEKAAPTSHASVVRKAAVITNISVPSVSTRDEIEHPVNDGLRSKEELRKTTSAHGQVSGQPKLGVVRKAAGKVWVDTQLSEWPENDFRIFVGNLGKEVTDAVLSHAFSKYPSFTKAKVMRSKDGQGKGFGFVSLGSIQEGAQALREMNGHYIGSRPCKVKKAATEERTLKDKRGKVVKRTSSKHHVVHPYKNWN